MCISPHTFPFSVGCLSEAAIVGGLCRWRWFRERYIVNGRELLLPCSDCLLIAYSHLAPLKVLRAPFHQILPFVCLSVV